MGPAPGPSAPHSSETQPALPRVLLASRSPRRRELLTEHGVEHDAEHPGFDDALLTPGQVNPEQWVAALAYLKAWAGVRRAAEAGAGGAALGAGAGLVVGADTACVKDGRLIGTPRDAREAEGMIRALAGGEHDVVTGLAVICPRTSRRWIQAERAHVRLGALSDAEIARYIAGGAWAGKAGAYNLRERVGAGWPIECVGDPHTVMGLPVQRLLRVLRWATAPGDSGRTPGVSEAA